VRPAPVIFIHNGAPPGAGWLLSASVWFRVKPTRWEIAPGIDRSWSSPRRRPKTAFSRLPPVHRADLQRQQRVELARSPNRRRMSGNCAQRPLIIANRTENRPPEFALVGRDSQIRKPSATWPREILAPIACGVALWGKGEFGRPSESDAQRSQSP